MIAHAAGLQNEFGSPEDMLPDASLLRRHETGIIEEWNLEAEHELHLVSENFLGLDILPQEAGVADFVLVHTGDDIVFLDEELKWNVNETPDPGHSRLADHPDVAKRSVEILVVVAAKFLRPCAEECGEGEEDNDDCLFHIWNNFVGYQLP